MTTPFETKMTVCYFVAFIIALPFFGLVLITISGERINRVASTLLDLVIKAEGSLLARVEKILWRHSYRWLQAG